MRWWRRSQLRGREPRPRAEHHPVRGHDRSHRLRAGCRAGREQGHAAHPASRRRDGDLAPDPHHRAVRLLHDGLDVERFDGHRQHPALHPEQAGHPVEPGDRVLEQLPERDDEQVADRVLVQGALAAEPVLHDLAPRAAPLVVAAERGQRPPQVTRGEHAELAPQPAARPAVVGDGDDGRGARRHPAQCLEAVGEAVAPTERHDRGEDIRLRRGRVAGRHSRPRSRCRTVASTPCARIRVASSSAMATERCLPPVQPIATVA